MTVSVTPWLVSTVTVAAQASTDSYGDPTFSAQTTVAARVESKQQLVLAADGNEYQSNHVICSAAVIPLNARVWLPGDTTSDNNQARRPIAIDSATDKAGGVTLYMTYL